MKKIAFLLLRIVPATILLQTLYFKFTAAPESVSIFQQLGLEPHGRIGIGILEGIAAILLLVPCTVLVGAILAFGLMSGALLSHITKLGFSGDMGSLAFMALIVWVCSLILILQRIAGRRPSLPTSNFRLPASGYSESPNP